MRYISGKIGDRGAGNVTKLFREVIVLEIAIEKVPRGVANSLYASFKLDSKRAGHPRKS